MIVLASQEYIDAIEVDSIWRVAVDKDNGAASSPDLPASTQSKYYTSCIILMLQVLRM